MSTLNHSNIVLHDPLSPPKRMAPPPSTATRSAAHAPVSHLPISKPEYPPLDLSHRYAPSSSRAPGTTIATTAAGPSTSSIPATSNNPSVAPRPAFRWQPTDGSHPLQHPTSPSGPAPRSRHDSPLAPHEPYASDSGEVSAASPSETSSYSFSEQTVVLPISTSSSSASAANASRQHRAASSSLSSSSSSSTSSWRLHQDEKAATVYDHDTNDEGSHHDTPRRSMSDRQPFLSPARLNHHPIGSSSSSSGSSSSVGGAGLIEHQRHYGQRVKTRSCSCIPPAVKPWLPVRSRASLFRF